MIFKATEFEVSERSYAPTELRPPGAVLRFSSSGRRDRHQPGLLVQIPFDHVRARSSGRTTLQVWWQFAIAPSNECWACWGSVWSTSRSATRNAWVRGHEEKRCSVRCPARYCFSRCLCSRRVPNRLALSPSWHELRIRSRAGHPPAHRPGETGIDVAEIRRQDRSRTGGESRLQNGAWGTDDLRQVVGAALSSRKETRFMATGNPSSSRFTSRLTDAMRRGCS